VQVEDVEAAIHVNIAVVGIGVQRPFNFAEPHIAIAGLKLQVALDAVHANIAVVGVNVQVGFARHPDFNPYALRADAEAHMRSFVQLDFDVVAGLVSGDLHVVLNLPAPRDDAYVHLLAGPDDDLDVPIVGLNCHLGFAGNRIAMAPFVGAG
jgi:hypothetical protein